MEPTTTHMTNTTINRINENRRKATEAHLARNAARREMERLESIAQKTLIEKGEASIDYQEAADKVFVAHLNVGILSRKWAKLERKAHLSARRAGIA
jgi:hypothetical protein